MSPVLRFFRTLLPLLLLPLALLLVGASVVAPVLPLVFTTGVASQGSDSEDGEESEQEKREAERAFESRGQVATLPVARQPKTPRVALRPGLVGLPAHPAADAWMAPRRL